MIYSKSNFGYGTTNYLYLQKIVNFFTYLPNDYILQNTNNIKLFLLDKMQW